MKVGAIIFSRMSSSRLPGKAFKDVSGKFLLERVIDRTIKVNLVDHICLATSTNSEDDKIVEYAKYKGLEVFRGSLDDVAKRAFDASKYYNYSSFLRVCADRPFLDPSIYDEMIKIHNEFLLKKIRSKMLLQVHDELVFECPEDEVKKVSKIIKVEMETAHLPICELNVPVIVDFGEATNWSAAH